MQDVKMKGLSYTILPANDEYQNYGIMPALDHIFVLKDISGKKLIKVKTRGGGGGGSLLTCHLWRWLLWWIPCTFNPQNRSVALPSYFRQFLLAPAAIKLYRR